MEIVFSDSPASAAIIRRTARLRPGRRRNGPDRAHLSGYLSIWS